MQRFAFYPASFLYHLKQNNTVFVGIIVSYKFDHISLTVCVLFGLALFYK